MCSPGFALLLLPPGMPWQGPPCSKITLGDGRQRGSGRQASASPARLDASGRPAAARPCPPGSLSGERLVGTTGRPAPALRELPGARPGAEGSGAAPSGAAPPRGGQRRGRRWGWRTPAPPAGRGRGEGKMRRSQGRGGPRRPPARLVFVVLRHRPGGASLPGRLTAPPAAPRRTAGELLPQLCLSTPAPVGVCVRRRGGVLLATRRETSFFPQKNPTRGGEDQKGKGRETTVHAQGVALKAARRPGGGESQKEGGREDKKKKTKHQEEEGDELKRNSEDGGEERDRDGERKVGKGEQAEEDKGEEGGGGGESAKGRGGEERRALLKMALGRREGGREGARSRGSPLTALPAPGRRPPAPLCLAHTSAELTSFWLSGKGKRHLCEAGP